MPLLVFAIVSSNDRACSSCERLSVQTASIPRYCWGYALVLLACRRVSRATLRHSRGFRCVICKARSFANHLSVRDCRKSRQARVHACPCARAHKQIGRICLLCITLTHAQARTCGVNQIRAELRAYASRSEREGRQTRRAPNARHARTRKSVQFAASVSRGTRSM